MAPSKRSKVQRETSTPVTAVGSGYNTFLGAGMRTIVDVKTDPGLGSTAASVYVCKTTQQVYNALEINASISVSSAWGSFADKLDMISTLNTNTTSVVIIVTATVVKNSWTVSEATFKSPYTAASDVYKQGGDSYVSYIATGGQFIAAYSFVAYDEETYQELNNVADISFPGWGADFDANFEINIKKMSQSTGVTYHNEFQGIGYTGPMPQPEDLVQYVLTFANITLDTPAVLDFATTSYRDVPTSPDFTQIDAYRTAYYDPTSTGLGYADIELLAKTNLDIVTNVAGIYDTYGCLATDPMLTTVPPNLNYIIASIALWRQTVDTDPTNPNVDPPIIDDQFLTVPIPQYSIIPSTPAGSFSAPDGYAFQDITEDMIQRGVLPTSVQIWGGGVIDQLTTTYTQNDEDMPTFTLTRGSSTSGGYPPVQWGPGEQVTQIITLWDDHICRMSITTTSQPGILYPWNGNGPNLTTWSTPADGSTVFVGWQGKFNASLDGLQALYVQFRAAHWKLSTMEKPIQKSTALKKAASKRSPRPKYPLGSPLRTNSLRIDKPLDFGGRQMPNEDDVLTIIIKWATANAVKIGEAYLQKGGWEGWAQVELAMAFKKAFPKVTVQREVHAFDVHTYKADFMLTHDPDQPIIIEIKCESSGQDIPGPSAFWLAYTKDLEKATNYEIDPNYLPATVWTIGFTCKNNVSQEGKNRLENGKFGPYNVGWWPGGQTGTGDMVLVWASVDYITPLGKSKL